MKLIETDYGVAIAVGPHWPEIVEYSSDEDGIFTIDGNRVPEYDKTYDVYYKDTPDGPIDAYHIYMILEDDYFETEGELARPPEAPNKAKMAEYALAQSEYLVSKFMAGNINGSTLADTLTKLQTPAYAFKAWRDADEDLEKAIRNMAVDLSTWKWPSAA